MDDMACVQGSCERAAVLCIAMRDNVPLVCVALCAALHAVLRCAAPVQGLEVGDWVVYERLAPFHLKLHVLK